MWKKIYFTSSTASAAVSSGTPGLRKRSGDSPARISESSVTRMFPGCQTKASLS